jgi:tetratricopeptide (TPR) repeat protein
VKEDWRRQHLANGLMDDARELLAKRRFKKAWKVGRRLHGLRYSGAYEIRAKAFQGLGRRAAALALLRRGVRRAPHAAMLWSLLGEVLSDAGRYEEALVAFEAGEGIEGNPNPAIFRGNRALVLVRAGRLEEAEITLAIAEGEAGGDDPGAKTFLAGVRSDLEEVRRLPSLT